MRILYLPNQYSQQRQREKRRWIWPVVMAMEATYHRNQGHHVQWGSFFEESVDKKEWDKIIIEPEGIPFRDLPIPDRILTNAGDKKYQTNGNYKYHPGTYMQAAQGCWHGKCSFCVEKENKWEVRWIC